MLDKGVQNISEKIENAGHYKFEIMASIFNFFHKYSADPCLTFKGNSITKYLLFL